MININLLEKLAYIAAYPILFFIMNNSRRTRVILCYKNEFVLVKPRLNFGFWTLPGGGIKKSETTKLAAIREVSEELGVHLKKKDLKNLSEKTVVSRGIKTTLCFFMAELHHKPKLETQWHEIREARWFNKNTLNHLAMSKREKRQLLELLAP